jgi:hypothetical protein
VPTVAINGLGRRRLARDPVRADSIGDRPHRGAPRQQSRMAANTLGKSRSAGTASRSPRPVRPERRCVHPRSRRSRRAARIPPPVDPKPRPTTPVGDAARHRRAPAGRSASAASRTAVGSSSMSATVASAMNRSRSTGGAFGCRRAGPASWRIRVGSCVDIIALAVTGTGMSTDDDGAEISHDGPRSSSSTTWMRGWGRRALSRSAFHSIARAQERTADPAEAVDGVPRSRGRHARAVSVACGGRRARLGRPDRPRRPRRVEPRCGDRRRP